MTADINIRIKRVMEYDGISEKEAKKKISNFDKNRENFQNRLFRDIIGGYCYYDLQINTTRIRPEQTADLVFKTLEMRGYNLNKMKIPFIEK
jgi:cytidylate kinase